MGENEDEQKEINSASDELSNIGNTTANIAKGTAKAAKKTAKTVKNITKLVKLLAKSKFVLMALPIIIKVVAVVLIVIAIIALFALIWMFLSVNLSKNVSDVIRNDNINSIVTIDNDKLEYSIDPKFKEQIEDILSIIQTSVAVTPEYIEKLYKAEIMASYPDLRPRDKIGTQYATNEKDDYFQGTIKIKRKYYDGKEELLEYMNYDDFREEVAKFGNYELLDKDGNISTQEKIYTSKKEVESGYDKLKKYFTLDSEYNLVVATISSTEVTNKYNDFAKKERRKIVDGKTVEGRKDNDKYKYEYNINIKKQNYQKSIERYVLPVEFNLIMLAVSQNQGFSEKLLELIEDTRITIEVQDNYTKNTVTEKYGYTAQFEYEKKVKYKEKIIVDDLNDSLQVNQIVDEDLQNPEDSITITQNNKEKWEDKEYKSEGKYTEQKNMDKPFSEITTNTQEILTNILVTDAKSWIGDFSVVYSYEKEEPEPTVSSVPLENDANFTTIVDYYVLHDEFIESLDDLPENVGETKDVEITSKKVKEKQKDKENITITKYESNRYIKSTVNIEEKEERFLSLLAVDPSSKPKQFNKVEINKNTEKLIYKDYSGKEFPPVENIFIFKNMMFEMLRNFENTQYLEEIMKYMLYMYSGKNYGVTTLDFSIYEPGRFSSIPGDIVNTGSIQEKVWFSLKNCGINNYAIAGAMGNIDYESTGFSTSAVEGGSGEGIGLCQWSFGRRKQLETYAESKGVSWKDEDTQVEFLIAEITGKGPAAQYANQRTSGYIKEENITSTVYDWQGSSSVNDATLYFMRFFESPKSKSSLEERQNRAQRYYDLYNNSNFGVSDHVGSPDIETYNLNIFKGFIEFKQGDYTKVPPYYQATQEPAGTIKDKGCMPTSICIILSGYGIVDHSGVAYTPETLISNGMIQHISGGSSTYGNATRTFRNFGFNTGGYKLTNSVGATEDILTNLNKGNAILIHADVGEYTGGGHYMTLLAANGQSVYLSNPGSRNKTGWRLLTDLINPKKGNVDWYTVVNR